MMTEQAGLVAPLGISAVGSFLARVGVCPMSASRQKRSFQNCHCENSISALSDLAASSNPDDLLMNETIPSGDIFGDARDGQ
jgi:hypothetical protein